MRVPDGDATRPPIDILMAAYNGEAFIAEQIESILRQRDAGWRLVIRDDGSTDQTLLIASDYARRHPNRITVQARGQNSGSAKQNFLEMLLRSDAPYVMFCDDDDVWTDDKITVTAARMRQMERELGAETPLLVHTDLTLTDRHLAVASPSMVDARQFDPTERRLGRLLLQNFATGCTVMVNRSLADLVREPFDAIIMHDWWLAMIASAFGAIGFVEAPTVLYRQHGSNTVGAERSQSLAYSLARFRDRDGTARAQNATFAQAESFLEHFGHRLSQEQTAMLRAYASIPQHGKAGHLRVLRRYDLWKNTAARRLAQIWFA